MNASPMAYQPSPDVVKRTIVGETLLVPVRGKLADLQKVFTLNAVGEFIWNALDGETDLDALVRRVVGEFEVSETQARGDCTAFLAQLSGAGLVEEVKHG